MPYEHPDFAVEYYVSESISGDSRVICGAPRFRTNLYTLSGAKLMCSSCGYIGVRHSAQTRLISPAILEDSISTSSELEGFLSGFKTCSLFICPKCGIWALEQNGYWDEDSIAPIPKLQCVGLIARFDDPETIPWQLLGDYLSSRTLSIDRLSAHDFELLVGGFLSSEWMPCEVKRIGQGPGIHDNGVDLILIKNDQEYLVQIKHHPVKLQSGRDFSEGVRPIRELNGVMYRDGVPRGVFVTSAPRYSPMAQAEAIKTRQSNPRYSMQLYDWPILDRWLRQSSEDFAPWNKALVGDASSFNIYRY